MLLEERQIERQNCYQRTKVLNRQTLLPHFLYSLVIRVLSSHSLSQSTQPFRLKFKLILNSEHPNKSVSFFPLGSVVTEYHYHICVLFFFLRSGLRIVVNPLIIDIVLSCIYTQVKLTTISEIEDGERKEIVADI